MAIAAGAKLGTGYVEIEPDFSKFQEKLGRRLSQALTPAMRKAGRNAGKNMASGLDQGGLGQALSPLLRRFERFGDDAGKVIANKIGKGSTRAKGDMFGLAGAVAEVERRSKKASTASKMLSNDMFGIAKAAKESGKKILSARAELNAWHVGARKAEGGAKELFGRLRGLGYEFGSVARGIRTSSGGFSGFDGVMARVNRGFSFFGNILRTLKWPTLVAGAGLLAQALSALAAAAIATASALGPLAGALVALPAGALAAAQAFGVLKLATAGIGGALKAAYSAETQGGTQAVQTMRQQRDAAERVADAKRNLTSVQRDATFAQQDLTKARKEAVRTLQDMRLESEHSRDSEQQGALQLRQARKELAKTLRDPTATGLDVRFAEEAVDQARNDLQQTRLDAKRAREDYTKAQKGGVEKMPEVVAAKRAEADANRSVTEAERDLNKAIRDNSETMKEQGSAATTLQEKMAMLPPAAQKFVRVLLSLKPRLDELRATAASGFFPGAEAGLKGLMRNFGVVKGVVAETAGALGKIAAKTGKKLGSAVWGKDLTRIGKLNTRIIGRMGDSALNLADAFRHVLISAEPFLDWLSESTKEFSGWIKNEAEAGQKSGALAEFFDRTRRTMELLGPILKGVGGGLLNVSAAAKPLGNEILKSLGGAAEGWRKWTDSTKGQNRLKQYFTETKPAIFELGRLVRDAGTAFFELGKQNGVATLLKLIRTQLVPALRDGAGFITGWASDFIRQFASLRKEGVPTFDAFIQVLAEHAGQAGWTIAKALVKGFLNASILGKLAIAGWLFSRFGGVKAFAKVGAEAGARFGKAMVEKAAAWFAGTEAGAGLIGRIQDLAAPGGRLGKASQAGGARLGRIFSRGLAAGVVLGLATLAPTIADALKKYVVEPGQSFIEEKLGAVGHAITSAQDFVAGHVKTGLPAADLIISKAYGQDSEIPAPKTDKAESKLHAYADTVAREGKRARKGFKDPVEQIPDIAERSSKGAYQQTVPRLGAMATQGGQKGEAFAGRVSSSFGSLAEAVKDALGNIETNVGGALKGLNAGKAPRFNLKKLVNSLPKISELPPLGRQEGGLVPAFATGGLASVVPGNTAGDRHTLSLNGRPVAKVESKEGIFVGNRNLMGALQTANAAVPRFQEGGLVQKLRRGGMAEPKIGGDQGSLHKLGQSAIHKVFEGAKHFLGKQGSAGGGNIANAGPLQQFNRIFPSHTLSNLAGKARFSEALVERIMRWAGLPGKLFAQIAHGESDFYPGIFGIDPGGSIGRGLLQITSGVGNDAMIARYGGPKAMFNPLVNALAGKEIYDQSGIGAWYGTKFVTGMQAGGLLKGFARGGKVGQPFNPTLMRGGPSSGPASLLSAAVGGFKPKTIGRIKSKAQEIASAFTGYVWGGGHGEGTHVTANGLDCSGAIAKLMQESGWSDFAVGVSGEYMSRLMPGRGDLFTLWSNPGHTFAEIEGTEWGTNSSNGLGYHTHTTGGFTPRHPELAPEAGASGAIPGAAPKENIPAKYRGASTQPLSLGQMPKTLEEVNKEIARLQGEIGTYRKAKRYAEKQGKPGIAQAVGRNVGIIEERLSGLRSLRSRLRLEGVKKNLKKRLGKRFKQFAGYEQLIEGAQGGYERAAQDTQQLVELEPQQPELPASASDAQREAAEKAYVANFSNYVETRERPAYGGLLDKVAGWRNTILRAEMFGFGKGRPSVAGMETLWEGEDRQTTNKIDQIKAFAKAVGERLAKYKAGHPKEALPDWLQKQVAERAAMLKELPILQLKDSELRKAIGEAREKFFPGGDNRIGPNSKGIPALPLPGSGSLEESLRDVQGIHWPDSHELLGASSLMPPRVAGKFGGVIWDVQTSIEELGVKINSAVNGLGSGGSSEEGTDNSALEELIRQANQRTAVSDAQKVTLENWDKMREGLFAKLPKFHSGGTVPGASSQESPIMALGRERIRTPEQELALAQAIHGLGGGEADPSIEIHFYEGERRALVRHGGREFEANVRSVKGVGLRTPGGAR